MKKFFFILIIALLFGGVVSSSSAYVAASPNYHLEKDSLNLGGLDSATSPNYSVKDTLGEIISGLSSGTSNSASSGYRYLESGTASSVPVAPTTTPVLGCTDPKALNYNPLATQDNLSCSYTPGGTIIIPQEIPGCTDSLAINYNSVATKDDGSCRYLKVVDSIPGCLDSRATNYDPKATEDDGHCTYSKDEEPPVIPPGEGGDNNGLGGGGGIFGSLPVATSSLTTLVKSSWHLSFAQPEEDIKTFDWRGRVSLSGDKTITIIFTPNKPLNYLKTIGVTLTDPRDKNKTFSFLLHRSADGLSYEATLSPLIKQGTYPLDIYIINYENQTTAHIRGSLIIPSPLIFWAETVVGQVAPVAVAGGLAFGFLPSFYDLLLGLFRAMGYFFGRRRHDKPWGTVYDSVTKRPLDPVYVTASQAGPDGVMKEVASAITDIDGRFSFFLPAGTYQLLANKTHYKFPSEKLQGKTTDEIYNDLYFGHPLVVTGEEIININIPMDSIDFDWNEFAKTKTNFYHFYTRQQIWLKRLYNFFFALGFVLSVTLLFLNPSLLNLAVLFLYVAVILLNKFWRDKRRPLKVVREGSDEPLPFAIIRVFLPDLNQQIKSVVADKFGRFYLLVRPGVYYYTVEEKQLDGSYLKTYQSGPVNFSKGILTRDISVK